MNLSISWNKVAAVPTAGGRTELRSTKRRLPLMVVAASALSVAMAGQAGAIDPRRATEERATPDRPAPRPTEPAATTGAPAPPVRRSIVTPPVDGYWLITGNDNVAIFSDQSAVVRTGERVRMWTVWVNRAISTEGEKSFQAMLEFDCAAGTARIAQFITYNAMGENLATESGTDPLSYPAPGTVLDHVTQHACADFAEWARLESLRIIGITDLVSYADASLFPRTPAVLQPQTVQQASGINSELNRTLTEAVRGYLDLAQRDLLPGRAAVAGAPDRIAALQPGRDLTIKVPLISGVTYFVVGACDDDCKDIDIELSDARGLVVAADDANADFPRMRFTPIESGPYEVRVMLQQCSLGPCYVGARLLQ